MQVARFFDGYARDFDAIYGTSRGIGSAVVNSLFRRSMLIRFDKTVYDECLRIEGREVLDVGCGPGHYSVALVERGAKFAHGIDFAPAMIDISVQRAKSAGVASKCSFEVRDFLTFPETRKYDYVILMGFMDYIENPAPVIAKARAIATHKALFSFPKAGGFLAWQRRLRYKARCPLYLYSEKRLQELFAGTSSKIESAARDFYVVAYA